MHVALVILHADRKRGGAERFTIDLAERLLDQGHRVSLLAAGFGDGTPDAAGSAERVTLAHHGPTRLTRYLRFLDALDAHLDDTLYDVVHAMLPVDRCDVYHPHAGFAVVQQATAHRAKAGRLARGLSWVGNRFSGRRRMFAKVERTLLQQENPPFVLSLSETMKQELLARLDVPQNCFVTLYNGVDLRRFDPGRHPEEDVRRKHGLGHDDTVALFVAQDFARKGLAQVIHAMGRLRHPRLRLLVVGGDDHRPFRDLAKARRVHKFVTFAGPQADTHAYYHASDLLVMPSRHDPFPLAVLEALAMGLPVVLSRQVGVSEIIDDGRHGYVVEDWRDVKALAVALGQLCVPADRVRLRRAVVELRPTLGTHRHMTRLLDVYDAVIQQKRAAGVLLDTPPKPSDTPPDGEPRTDQPDAPLNAADQRPVPRQNGPRPPRDH
ncbi:MAG: glycosyltransferase family 4 protein [Phycisphaerae bacterium]